MLRNEFEKGYCERSDITLEFYRQNFVSLPCSCGEDDCEGWATISLDPSLLLFHLWHGLPGGAKLRTMENAELRAAVGKDGGR